MVLNLAALNDLSPVDQLRALHEAGPALHRATEAAVINLRRQGVTWQTIGDVLGTTRQAAQARFRVANLANGDLIDLDDVGDRVTFVTEHDVEVSLADGSTRRITWEDLRECADRRRSDYPDEVVGRYEHILAQAEARAKKPGVSPVEVWIDEVSGQSVLRAKYMYGGHSAPGDGASNNHRSWVEQELEKTVRRCSGHEIIRR